MRQHTLYAYVEGNNFGVIANELSARFSRFVADRNWVAGDVWPVNQKRAEGEPAWELGMNLELPNRYEEPAGWFADIEAIAIFLRELATDFGVECVIGIADTERGIADDLFSIDSGPIDIEKLQAIIGIGP